MKKMELKADVVKNRIYMVLAGFITDKEMNEFEKMSDEVFKVLKPGFSSINDISEFKPASQHGTAILQKTQLAAKKAGIGKVIRVVKSAGGQMQFERISRETGMEAEVASSIEEAEKMLDQGN